MRSTVKLFLAFCLCAGTSLADGPTELEESLRNLQASDVTYEALGRAYKLRTNAPNAQIAGEVTKACGAGLLYVNRQDFYAANLRPRIPDVQAFEQSMRVPCAKCNGQGRASQPCPQCGGTGKCKSFNCRDGQAEFKGMNGRVDYRPCPACKGTGNCPKCNGRATMDSPCATCMGKGSVFSAPQALTVCRDSAERARRELERIRQGVPAEPAQSLPAAPATQKTSPAPGTLEPATGDIRIPRVLPPAGSTSDPETRKIFDQLVKEYYERRITLFKEAESNGWTWMDGGRISGSTETKREARQKWFDVPERMPEDYWREAERIAEDRRGDREAEEYQRSLETRRRSEDQAKEDRKAFSAQFVRDAIARAEKEIAGSGVSYDHVLSSEDATKAMSSDKYTEVQRQRAREILWERAMPHPQQELLRVMFVPVPSGLPYRIRDVQAARNSKDYILFLEGIEAKYDEPYSRQILPADTFQALSKSLCPPMYIGLENPLIIVPADDPALMDYNKGDVVESGEWIMPILLQAGHGLLPDKYVFRSWNEFNALIGATE